jgi:predicted metal-binding protein
MADDREKLIEKALAHGFSHAGPLTVDTLRLRQEVRDMCNADKCQRYDKSWMCPPACGSLEANEEKLRSYTVGLIVQTTGEMEDDFDYEVMMEAGEKQKELLSSFQKIVEQEYPDVMPLTNGGCTLCETCTYPDEPCRRPDEATPSMEAFGLVVSDVCRDNGIDYYYGPNTITYTGCYLFNEH